MEPLKTGVATQYPSPDARPRARTPSEGTTAQTRFVPLVIAIAAVAVFLRVFHLDYLSLWSDELFSRYYYDLFGPAYMVTSGLTIEPTPPLYYFILEPWMKLFGHTAIALRALSVVASLIALPLVYAVAREVSNRSVALVSIALFALSPLAIYFSQEARVYMMTVIPACLMLLGVARYLRRAYKTDLLMYGITAVIALYSHATMVFLVAACNLVVFAYLLLTPSPQRGSAIGKWVAVNAVVGLLWLPLLVSMLSIGKHGTGLSWIPPLRLWDILSTLTGLMTGVATPYRLPGVELTGLTFLVVGAAVAMSGMPRRTLAVAVGIPAAFFALVVIASLRQPILLTRILCWITVPLCITLAYAVVTPSRVRNAALGMVVLTFAVGLFYQLFHADGAKPPYREIFEQTRTQLLQADEVVNAPYTSSLILNYYVPDLTTARKWSEPSVSGIEANAMVDKLGTPRMNVQQVRADIKDGKTVWLLATSPDAKFLPDLFDHVAAPAARYVEMCNAVVRHGIEPPPCVAAYGWNLKSGGQK